jgi:hypothetical protein
VNRSCRDDVATLREGSTGRGPHNSDRATLARLAAHERWARVRDRSAATAAARRAADDRFFVEARRLHPGVSEEEIIKRARNLRSAHAIRAARTRWSSTTRRDSQMAQESDE